MYDPTLNTKPVPYWARGSNDGIYDVREVVRKLGLYLFIKDARFQAVSHGKQRFEGKHEWSFRVQRLPLGRSIQRILRDHRMATVFQESDLARKMRRGLTGNIFLRRGANEWSYQPSWRCWQRKVFRCKAKCLHKQQSASQIVWSINSAVCPFCAGRGCKTTEQRLAQELDIFLSQWRLNFAQGGGEIAERLATQRSLCQPVPVVACRREYWETACEGEPAAPRFVMCCSTAGLWQRTRWPKI